MSGCWLHGSLCLTLVLILAAATAMTILNFDWLDQNRMRGPVIISRSTIAAHPTERES